MLFNVVQSKGQGPSLLKVLLQKIISWSSEVSVGVLILSPLFCQSFYGMIPPSPLPVGGDKDGGHPTTIPNTQSVGKGSFTCGDTGWAGLTAAIIDCNICPFSISHQSVRNYQALSFPIAGNSRHFLCIACNYISGSAFFKEIILNSFCFL